MEWLILLLLVPALLVPVVLLCGFAGCTTDYEDFVTGPPPGPPGAGPPSGDSAPQDLNLSAVAKSESSVLLTWDNIVVNSPWWVWRMEDGGSVWFPVTGQGDPAGTTDTAPEPVGTPELVEGHTYIYQVSASNVTSNPSLATVLPKTPSDLVATPVGLDEIELNWSNASTAAGVEFQLEYWESGSFQKLYRGPDTTYRHNEGLTEGTQYDYRVFSIVNGVENSVQQQDGVWSEESMVVSATTFKPAFEVDPNAAQNNQLGFAGDYCFVQRISADNLLAGGPKVGIKVHGAPPSNVKINSIYISQVGPGNPWNSAGDLTPVMTSPLTLPDDKPKNLDPVVYTLDKNQDLIIAFDFFATLADNIRYVSPQPGVTLYFKAGVQQASVATRDLDYSTGPSILYLVVTIGVP